MKEHDDKYAPTSPRPKLHWWLFCLLACAWFLARGGVYLAVIPPLEMWDELQHIAYVDHHTRHAQAPRLFETRIPPPLLGSALQLPHGPYSAHQLGDHAPTSYADWFAGTRSPQPSPSAQGPGLYAAQHGSLYYRTVAPLFAAAGGAAELSQSSTVLRSVNLLLGTLALLAVLLWLPSVLRNPRDRGLVALLIVAQPLYLLNVVRTANDALAILLGTFVCIAGISGWPQRRAWLSLLLGVLAGIAFAVKATCAAALVFILMVTCWRSIRRPRPQRSWTPVLLLSLGAAPIVGLILWSNLARYGLPLPMQEAVLNRDAGRGLGDVLAGFWDFSWLSTMQVLLFRESTWVGGWSFLGSSNWLKGWTQVILIGAALGWVCRPFRSRDALPVLRGDPQTTRRIGLCLLLVAGGLLWHSLQSELAHGTSSTCPWYACLAFPFALILLWRSAASWPPLVGRVLPWILLASFVLNEANGIWRKMLPTYSGGARGTEALRRLATLKPGWPTFEVGVGSGVLALVLLIALILAVARLRDADPLGRSSTAADCG